MPHPERSEDVPGGHRSATLTTERADATACVAKEDWPKKCDEIGASPERKRRRPVRTVPAEVSRPRSRRSSPACPDMQAAHWPHELKLSTTWSPGATLRGRRRRPARQRRRPRGRSTAGSGTGTYCSRITWSVWQTPVATMRISTSPGPAPSSSSSRSSNGAFLLGTTAAVIFMASPSLLCPSPGPGATLSLPGPTVLRRVPVRGFVDHKRQAFSWRWRRCRAGTVRGAERFLLTARSRAWSAAGWWSVRALTLPRARAGRRSSRTR